MAASGLVIENNRTLPYGEEWLPATGSANEQKFTSYQRDGESGLDYAIHRFDATTRGVFMSADRGPISLGLPQSLNRYIYAMADPVNYTDPDGMQPQSDDPPAYNAYAAFLDWLFTRHSQSLLTGILYGIEEPQLSRGDLWRPPLKPCVVTSGRQFGTGHYGTDFAANAGLGPGLKGYGTPVKSITQGNIVALGTTEARFDNNRNIWVGGENFLTVFEKQTTSYLTYMHISMKENYMSRELASGDLIGRVDESGLTSTGPHVHIFGADRLFGINNPFVPVSERSDCAPSLDIFPKN